MDVSWKEIGLESFRMAQKLLDLDSEEALRSSVSRSYFSAYSLITAFLSPAQFFRGRQNPDHSQLPRLVNSASQIEASLRATVSRSARFLRAAREDADYRPRRTVDKQTAMECLRRVRAIMRALDVNP